MALSNELSNVLRSLDVVGMDTSDLLSYQERRFLKFYRAGINVTHAYMKAFHSTQSTYAKDWVAEFFKLHPKLKLIPS